MQPSLNVQATANTTFLAFPHCLTPIVSIQVTVHNSIQTMNVMNIALYYYQKWHGQMAALA
jgi:hypothetical protein